MNMLTVEHKRGCAMNFFTAIIAISHVLLCLRIEANPNAPPLDRSVGENSIDDMNRWRAMYASQAGSEARPSDSFKPAGNDYLRINMPPANFMGRTPNPPAWLSNFPPQPMMPFFAPANFIAPKRGDEESDRGETYDKDKGQQSYNKKSMGTMPIDLPPSGGDGGRFLDQSAGNSNGSPWSLNSNNYATPLDQAWLPPMQNQPVVSNFPLPAPMGNVQQSVDRMGLQPAIHPFSVNAEATNNQLPIGQPIAGYPDQPAPLNFNGNPQDSSSNVNMHTIQAGYKSLLNAMYPMDYNKANGDYQKGLDFNMFGPIGANMYETQAGDNKDNRQQGAYLDQPGGFSKGDESATPMENSIQTPPIVQTTADQENSFPFSNFPPPIFSTNNMMGPQVAVRQGQPNVEMNPNDPSKFRLRMENGNREYETNGYNWFSANQMGPMIGSYMAPGIYPTPPSNNNWYQESFASRAREVSPDDPTAQRNADAVNSPLQLQLKIANATMTTTMDHEERKESDVADSGLHAVDDFEVVKKMMEAKKVNDHSQQAE